MSEIPSHFKEKWYDEDYFKTPEGKKYQYGDEVKGWSYANPDGEFLGAKIIAKAWKEVFNPEEMLDVGAGRGTFIAYARDAGIRAYGFDFSHWAVTEGRYPRCGEVYLLEHDATKPWPWYDDQFDFVVALDFYEHIYEDDLDFVLSEMFRVANKYVFLQIATVDGVNEKGFSLKKGEPVPTELEVYAVAGHVNVRTEDWWMDRLYRDEWFLRRDLLTHFISLIEPKTIIENWLANSVIVLEKM